MLTGLTAEAERGEGFSAGADDYITKPFHPQDLLSRVRVWSQTRQRFAAYQQHLNAQARALQEAERREMSAALHGIKLAARELSDLVNNQLTFAKASAGRKRGRVSSSPRALRVTQAPAFESASPPSAPTQQAGP
jgi:DNA-binding response OmpR family regulator